MRIGVIGLGYVGVVTAVCLARDGHSVVGVDIEQKKLDLLLSGQSPIVEEGLAEIAAAAQRSGNLTAIRAIDAQVGRCDLIFVCVGTPSAPNGSQSLAAVERVAEQLGTILRDTPGYPVVVVRSTVPPGTTDRVVRPILERISGKKCGENFGLCFQPEFLREGSSVKDFYNPPFTIVGSEFDRPVRILRDLFGTFPAEFLVTSTPAAELMKLACNAFHALKVSFANEIGRVSRSLSIDAREVMSLFCRDMNLNISSAYLRPGFAYGGSCLPKDLRALQFLAKQTDNEVPVIQAVQTSNIVHIQHAAELVKAQPSRKIGVIGLSFKAGTDDLRESPLVALSEHLIGKGYDLKIYDPAVGLARLIGSNKKYIDDTIPHVAALLADRIDEVFAHADVIVVGLKSKEVIEALNSWRKPNSHVVDFVGISEGRPSATGYTGICW